MKRLIFCSALFLSIVQLAYAHSGGTDYRGCHKNSQTGVEHCHNKNQKPPINKHPISSFITKPSIGIAPLVVDLDAIDSFDLDGTITTYTWEISNGQTASGETASLTFNQTGTYTIVLTVTDNDGATDTSQKIVTVVDELPVLPKEPTAKKPPCTAIYYRDGRLYIPCVQVDGEPAVIYNVDMTLSSPKPLSFTVTEVKTVEESE